MAMGDKIPRPEPTHVEVTRDELAVSRPERNRWPHEPEETHEPGERDRLGRFLIDHLGRRIRYRDDNDNVGETED